MPEFKSFEELEKEFGKVYTHNLFRPSKPKKKKGRKRKPGPKPRKAKTPARRTTKPKSITIISRKEQQQPVIRVTTSGPPKKSYPLRHVSSSWIGQLGYSPDFDEITMVTFDKKGNRRGYAIKDVPFSVWEGWYMAHSKGTYFNKVIKGNYKIEQLFA
jgi:hypothetical protein